MLVIKKASHQRGAFLCCFPDTCAMIERQKMGNYLDVSRKITNFALCIAKNHKNYEEADVCKQIKP